MLAPLYLDEKFSVLDNFFVFDSKKVSRFGKSESSAKVRNLPELRACFTKKYMQKIVNGIGLMTYRKFVRL